MNRFFQRTAPALVAVGVLLGLATPAAAGELLPFLGTADEVVTDVTPLGPTLVQLTVATTGEATYLGRYTSTATLILDLTTGGFVGTRVFIAANGDQLFADEEGTFTSATTAEATITFTGGTGRFQGASGEADLEATTPDGIHFTASGEGTIEF